MFKKCLEKRGSTCVSNSLLVQESLLGDFGKMNVFWRIFTFSSKKEASVYRYFTFGRIEDLCWRPLFDALKILNFSSKNFEIFPKSPKSTKRRLAFFVIWAKSCKLYAREAHPELKLFIKKTLKSSQNHRKALSAS